MLKKPALVLMSLATLGLAACEKPADVASRNLSYAVYRRVIFFNGITDKYLMTIEGLCSLGNFDTARQLSITCKTGPSDYKKHFLGLSDNVSYFVEQTLGNDVSTYHYKVIFRPETLLPSIGLDVSALTSK